MGRNITSLREIRAVVSKIRLKKARERCVQVSAHDDEEVVPLWNFGSEKVCVLDGLRGRVDGARPDDDEKTVILAGEDPSSSKPGGSNSGKGALGRDDLVAEEGGLDEGIVLGGWERKDDGGEEREIRCEGMGRGKAGRRRTPMTLRSWM